MIDPTRRHWGLGLRAGIRWVLNPVSEGGAAQGFRLTIAVGGPEVLRTVDAMRAHPTGARILAERPDLGRALTDMEPLSRMPAGSLGRAYFDFMDHPDTIAGYLLTGLAYRDGFFDHVQLDDDARYALERWFFTHDITHVLSGYGADLSGEALNILFTLGWTGPVPKALAFASPFGIGVQLFSPRVGRRQWLRHLGRAFDRGRAASRTFPMHSVPYEELLPRPLDEVRAELGIEPLPGGWDTGDWLEHSWFARQVSNGFGQMEGAKRRAKAAQAAVEAGVPWRDLVRASPDAQARVRRLVRGGAPVDDLVSALAS